VVLIARNKQKIVLPLYITDYTKTDNEIRNINQKQGAIDILVNAAALFMKTVTEIMKTQKSGYIFNMAFRNQYQ
jgi:short-subunit dehydrogenase